MEKTENRRRMAAKVRCCVFVLSGVVLATLASILLPGEFTRSDGNWIAAYQRGARWALHWILSSAVTLKSASWPAWVPLWSIPMPRGLVDRRMPSVDELRREAYLIKEEVESLKQHKFFRIFKIDLNKECPFWVRQEMCVSPGACHVCECDQDEVPAAWKLKPTENFVDRHHYESAPVKPWDGVYRGADGEEETFFEAYGVSSVPSTAEGLLGKPNYNRLKSVSDESSNTASYVDLTLNRPGFTAYRGRNIWRLIYLENCMGHVANPFERVTDAKQPSECTEEEAFYKIVSGMQTAIMVLASEYHYPTTSVLEYNKKIEEYRKRGQIYTHAMFRADHKENLQLFKDRVSLKREWLENLYFTFGILMRTLCRTSPILEKCSCETGSSQDDAEAREKLLSIFKKPLASCRNGMLDAPLFHRKQLLAMQQFHNISRIMDCLECEKCRLHGKVKIVALQLALRALGFNSEVRRIERNEVIALINSLGYFADSIISVDNFQRRLIRLRCLWVSTICAAIVSIIKIAVVLRRRSALRNGSGFTADTEPSGRRKMQ